MTKLGHSERRQDIFQMPSWSIGCSADPAVPDGLDAVRQTVDPVRGGGGLIVRLLT